MNARRPLACVAAVGALLALSACEKPAPIVTVVSGGDSVYAEASTWCFEGQTGDECAERETDVTSIPVRAGETVGVDVDKELAEGGWYLELAAPGGGEGEQQPQRSEPQEGHYFSFTAPSLAPGSSLQLDVRAVGDGEEPRGQFRFELVPAE
jgi:Protein of unknown function (DUF2771)